MEKGLDSRRAETAERFSAVGAAGAMAPSRNQGAAAVA
jgi:hypothetical protein